MKFNTRSFAPLVALSALCLASCADGSSTATAMTDTAANTAMFKSIRSHTAAGSGVYFADDLGDYLPQQRVQIDDQDPIPLSPGIVLGSISNATVTGAYALDDSDGNPATRGSPVAVDDPDADWRVITASFEVDQEWTDQVQVGQTITINLSIGGKDDPAVFVKGLESMDRAVVALEAQNQIGDADYAVARSGALLGEIESGAIRFPALESDLSFVGALKDPHALEHAANQSRNVIHVNHGVVQHG